MSIHAVRWRNFRGFEDSGWADLRPLTVIIGPNNGGKSSLVKPLLLLKQTQESDDSSAALVTRGELARVGTYQELVYRHEATRHLQFALRYVPLGEGEPREIGEDAPGTSELSFRPDEGSHGQIRLAQYRIFDTHERPLLTRSLRDGGRYTLTLMSRAPQLSQPDASVDRRRYLKSVADAMAGSQPSKFLFTVTDVLEAAFPDAQHPEAGSVPRDAAFYIAITNFAAQQLANSLSELTYLGPLRDPFRRIYDLPGDIPTDVGVAGSNAPEIIIARHLEAEFDYWVQKWIRRFGFTGGLQVDSAEPLGVHRLQVRASPAAPAVNIADSGFGLSQVLPFIVHGAHASKRSTLIAEQPEIHLNPKLQVTLADLLVAIVKSGRRVIVETHSEHLLTRLRVLVAQHRLSAADVGIMYVEKAGYHSQIRHVEVGSEGEIAAGTWPQGFFEESMRAAVDLLRARR